jgi:hypothetical protein
MYVVGLDQKASLRNLPQCSGDMVQQRHHNNDFEGPRHSVKSASPTLGQHISTFRVSRSHVTNV